MIAAFLQSRLGKLLITLVTAAGVLLGAMRMGAVREKEAAKVKDLEDHIKTKEAIEDVEVSPTSDAAFERLRDNGWVR